MSSLAKSMLPLFSLALLTGCPVPPDQQVSAPQPGVAASAPGTQTAPPAAGEAAAQPAAAPAGGAAGGAGEAGAGDPNVMAVGPGGISFDSLIQGGDTVTINVTINGINKGQIDFHVMEEGDGGLIPSPLHIEKFKGAGPHAIKAPAKYPRPIYLSALTDPEARAAEEDHGFGALAEPIKLDGTDVNVTINKGDKAPWMAKIAVPDQPPGDGEPALPPEEGDKGQTGGVPGAPLVEGKPPGEE